MFSLAFQDGTGNAVGPDAGFQKEPRRFRSREHLEKLESDDCAFADRGSMPGYVPGRYWLHICDAPSSPEWLWWRSNFFRRATSEGVCRRKQSTQESW